MQLPRTPINRRECGDALVAKYETATNGKTVFLKGCGEGTTATYRFVASGRPYIGRSLKTPNPLLGVISHARLFSVPLSRRTPKVIKLGLWLGTPSLVTFLASSYSVRVENTLLIFALSVIALLVGIGPRLSRKNAGLIK